MTYEVQTLGVGRWETVRRMEALSAAEYFLERIPEHELPGRIVQEIASRAGTSTTAAELLADHNGKAALSEDIVTGGFRISLTITTDDIVDLLAYGRKLRDAHDGSSEEITTAEQAAKEVGWLFAHEGVSELAHHGGVYAEISEVDATPIYEGTS